MDNPAFLSIYAKTIVAFVLSLGGMMAATGSVAAASDSPIEATFDHVAFEVSDIDRSIKFYTDNFGFKLMRRGDFASGNPSDPKNADLSAAFLQIPGSSAIELIQIRKSGSDGHKTSSGTFHLGLVIKDVRAAYKALSARGVKFDGEPTFKKRNGTYVVSAEDPDGIRLELIEVPSTAPTASTH